MQPINISAYNLIHQGALALSHISQTGMRIDTDYCERMMEEVETKIKELTLDFDGSDLGRQWKKKYGSSYNMGSDTQLGAMLYDEMKLEPPSYTDKFNPSVNQTALEALNIPDLKIFLEIRKWNKANSTYFGNILRETNDDGFLRPFFNLNTVATYRSSSSNVNFQNIPVRDPEVGVMIRRAFLPRPGRQIFEPDYGGIEVKVAACYNHDPVFIEDILAGDMHRDMAMECFILTPEEMGTKGDKMFDTIRYCSKNMFVFPQFYGSYFVSCARDLWEAIDQMGLKTAQGVSLKRHLKSKGIRNQATFEKHLEKVEDEFWNERYSVYTSWKDSNIKNYDRNGYIDTLTGFRCQGVMTRNQINNYPIQGSAFHCLLWSLIQINNWLRDSALETKIIGQIHDSIAFDLVPEEKDEVIEKVLRVTTEDIREHWDWIILPLEVEADLTPIDAPWSDKKEIRMAA